MARFLLPALLMVVVLCSLTASAFYGAKSPVVTLTPENFDEKVLKSEDVWIVEFYAPWCGHCKRLTPEWEGAAKQLKSTEGIHFGAVDADKYGALGGKYGVQGFPTLKVFGYDKEKPREFNSRQQAAIVHSAKHELKRMEESKKAGKDVELEEPAKPRESSGFYDGSDVVELTDDNFEAEVIKKNEPWLIEFYAPWCGHCKSLTPTWKELATEMLGQVRIGAVDVTANEKVGKQYGVQSFPTLKFLPPGGEPVEEYNGGRGLGELKGFCEKKAEQFPMGAFEVKQINSQKVYEDECLSKLLCVTFVLPHLMDTGVAGRNKYIETITEVGKKFRAKASINWVQGGDNYDWEEAFAVTANYPTFVAVGSKKKIYAKFAGKFDAPTLIASINKLLSPKGVFHQIPKIPKLEEGIELWDGKEYVPPSDDE